MTKNAAAKKAAREYQAAHPGMTYPEAKRRATAEWEARRAVKAEEERDGPAV